MPIIFLPPGENTEQACRNHVKNDLDPYVCLFEDCEEAELLYNHSDKWLSHLHQHSKLWRCSSHRELGPFFTREDYIRHIRETHNTNLSDIQLRVLAKKNARKAMKLFSSCPMCGKDVTEVDGPLEDHITDHLISLALESLPSHQDEIPDDNRENKDWVGASQPQGKRTFVHLMEGEDTLEYGTEHIKKKRPNPSPAPIGSPGAHSLYRSLSFGSSTSVSFTTEASMWPSSSSKDSPSSKDSLSSKPSARRLSAGQVPLLPRPRPHLVTDRDNIHMINGKPIPKEPRGKRTGPLRGGRQLATKRRNERTVCIGCKMAKVMVRLKLSKSFRIISEISHSLISLYTYSLTYLLYKVYH